MHCRLPQQISCHKKIGRIVSRKLNNHDEDYICQILAYPKNKCQMLAQTLFQKNSSSSVRASMWSKQYIQHITTKVTDRLKHVSKFIKHTFKKCADSCGDINMALLQICTTPLGQGLPSPATLMFNRQVHGIMPVLDHKPIGQDCNDKHHSKLIDRQNRNNNDASPIFDLIPIGSAVAVQHEDRGPWTHGDHS